MTLASEYELSCGLPPGPDFADLAVLAEELGYARVWIFDSAPLWEDPFAHLALAAARTTRVGLATAVLIPTQRSVMAMASGIATVARLSAGRFRACFGTGYTARMAIGQPAMPLDAMIDYVASLRGLLAGETVVLDGRPARMLHWPGMAAARPVGVPLWLSVLGPRGNRRAPEVADGTIGPPHPTLPTATMVSGTVLDAGESPDSARVREAIGPWRVIPWHTSYAVGGAAAVDALPGGEQWRMALEALAPEAERHLLTFEGHVTHLAERDRPLLEHIDTRTMVGDPASIGRALGRLAATGFSEIMYQPSGPDVARELRAFAAAAAGQGG
ncbi:5,10-methylenetetrahydromethanopterin reductase [Frankia sp. EI5c]|uniref:LLM class flavin-dependent oxidoreductase n=1 Tax=Frankia sp. EI5c TaxID=683316 RepID=UPI0007C3F684|nr:LLM class flavin-dependent oxidoreductase [Frankia sp. EI5c]OAA25825.1 5,10-methylenetetrahydromethanopterin reductase [Frankia sp. EI5c]